MRSAELYEVATAAQRVRDALPDPNEATSENEKRGRWAARTAANDDYLLVWSAYNAARNIEPRLEELYPVRKNYLAVRRRLLEARSTAQERLARATNRAEREEAERAMLAAGGGLCYIDHYRCKRCGAVYSEKAALGSGEFRCPDCGHPDFRSPGFVEVSGGRMLEQPYALFQRFAGELGWEVDLNSVRPLHEIERMIANEEERLEKALAPARPILETLRKVAVA